MDVFNLIAGAASILGLGFSAWAVVEVRRLRRRYVRMGLLPDLVNRLEGHTAAFTTLLETASEDPSGTADEVARLDATLRDLTRFLDRSNKQEVRLVQRHIAHRRPVTSRGQVQSIRAEVNRLIYLLQTNVEEDQWT